MGFTVNEKLRYTKSHEWVRVEGGEAVMGITDYAQDKLSDVVFVDLPAAGKPARAGEALLVIESVKAAEDVYSPVTGAVSGVNGRLSANPELVNSDPFGEGWLLRITLANPSEVDSLMDAAAYRAFLLTV
jgi:glycine cleavage system H protein